MSNSDIRNESESDDELSRLLETCSQNILAAQAKIEEQMAELVVLRDTTETMDQSRAETVRRKQAIVEAIDTTTKQAAVLSEKEQLHQSRVNELNSEIKCLKFKLEEGSGWTEEQEFERRQLFEEIEGLNHSLESKGTLSLALQSDISKLYTLVEHGEAELEQETSQIADLHAQVEGRRREAALEQQSKLALEQKLQRLQLDMEQQMAVTMEREHNVQLEKKAIMDTEIQLREAKQDMERYLKEYEKLFQETQRLTEQLESLMYSNETTENENEARRRDIDMKERNVALLKAKVTKVAKARESVLEKLVDVESIRGAWEKEREELRACITEMSNCEIKSAWREGETLKKQLEDSSREREILGRKLGSSEKTSQLIFDLTKVNQNAKKNLQNEVNGFIANVKLQREQIEVLVQDRERHEQEANSASRRYYIALEQLKLQEVQIADLQRKIIDGGARLKQQQNLYESVRSDRNLYSKSLIESQEEISEMKRSFKIMNHQIEQLKEEITAKDHNLVKEHFNHHNVDKEREYLKNELTKIKKQIVSSEQIISNQRAEVRKLTQIIQEADEERQRQRKEYEAIVGERNILSSQLIRRNGELATVYEKLKINWSSLQRGEVRHAESATEVQFLTGRIKDMRCERDDSVLQITSIKDLHRTHHALERDLLQERNKIKALHEELEHPLNVHRWRALESSDPQRFEMLRNVHSLQRRIIKKTEKTFQTESLIQVKERLYVKLKNILGRQTSPELSEQLGLYQRSLREKRAQLKAMTAELSMYKEQVAEFRAEISSTAKNLDDAQSEWIRKQLLEMKEAH